MILHDFDGATCKHVFYMNWKNNLWKKNWKYHEKMANFEGFFTFPSWRFDFSGISLSKKFIQRGKYPNKAYERENVMSRITVSSKEIFWNHQTCIKWTLASRSCHFKPIGVLTVIWKDERTEFNTLHREVHVC